MKKLSVYIAFLFSVVAFAQNEQQRQLLEIAYSKKSKKSVSVFFENWNREIDIITYSEWNQFNDTLKNTYEAFAEFYKPVELDSLEGSKVPDNVYRIPEYLVLQNSIKVFSTKKIYYTEQEQEDYAINKVNSILTNEKTRAIYLRKKDGKLPDDTINHFGPGGEAVNFQEKADEKLVANVQNFRPIVKFGSKKAVYLSTSYEKLLNDFLGVKSERNISSTGVKTITEKQSLKRQNFLKNMIVVKRGFWSGYEFISYTKAHSITFDEHMKYAIVEYQRGSRGGRAIMKKEDGNWKLISAKKTWIQ